MAALLQALGRALAPTAPLDLPRSVGGSSRPSVQTPQSRPGLLLEDIYASQSEVLAPQKGAPLFGGPRLPSVLWQPGRLMLLWALGSDATFAFCLTRDLDKLSSPNSNFLTGLWLNSLLLKTTRSAY